MRNVFAAAFVFILIAPLAAFDPVGTIKKVGAEKSVQAKRSYGK